MKHLLITTLIMAHTLAVSAQSMTEQEIQDALNFAQESGKNSDQALEQAERRFQQNRGGSTPEIICYNGHEPSASGVGHSLEEAQADAKMRLSLNACLKYVLYTRTNDCKSLKLFLPPNTHPDEAAKNVQLFDEKYYPMMKEQGTLSFCQRYVAQDYSNQDYLSMLRMKTYLAAATDPMKGQVNCGPIDGTYNWIKNVSGKRQDFRGERGYRWASAYDQGLQKICDGK